MSTKRKPAATDALASSDFPPSKKSCSICEEMPCHKGKDESSSLNSTNSTNSTTTTTTTTTTTSSNCVNLNNNVPNLFTHAIPEFVWQCTIIPMIGCRELASIRATSLFFQKYWKNFILKNKIIVPHDVLTFEDALEMVDILCHQKMYLVETPLIVVLGPGVHVIQRSWTSSSSGTTYEHTLAFPNNNISLVGEGCNQTTVRGGLVVENNLGLITVKNMNVTSPTGMGLYVKGNRAKW